MFAIPALLSLAYLACGARAGPLFFAVSGDRNCTSFIQPISINATNVAWNISIPENDQQLMAFTVQEYSTGSTLIQDCLVGPSQINDTYNIYMEYCEPAQGASKASVLQFTHGAAADHNYWDVVINGDVSYSTVDAAIKAGYSTLTYDRLGVGLTQSKPDGINVVQGGAQTAIAIEIGQGLKDGSLGVGQHQKVIGVGHSLGSVINVAVASVAPDLLDGIILTGFTANATISRLTVLGFYGAIASTSNPTRFVGLPNDYLVTPSQSTDQIGFFSYPNYTQAALDQFSMTKQTYTMGELLSLSNPWFEPPANYTSPLLVMTGERDAIFCDGNCYSNPPIVNGVNITSQLDSVRSLFSGAKTFESYVVPGTGHGINFHVTAPSASEKLLDFLNSNGL